jgi:intracellular multiplication protein IcmJ
VRFPLFPSVKRRTWRTIKQSDLDADKEFSEVRKRAMEKGNHTCVFCGLKSMAAMDVHHFDDDHTNNGYDNLKVADPLCHMVNHIGQIGSRQGGIMVSLPALGQANLNHLLRTIFHVLHKGDASQKMEAKELLRHLVEVGRPAALEKWGSTSLTDFAEAMLLMTVDEYANRGEHFASERVLLNPGAFAHQTETWSDTLYKTLPLNVWEKIEQDARERGSKV